jgi:hypothetical protein
VGATYQLGAERGKGSLVRGRFPTMEGKPGWASAEPTGLLGWARKVAAPEGMVRHGGLGRLG